MYARVLGKIKLLRTILQVLLDLQSIRVADWGLAAITMLSPALQELCRTCLMCLDLYHAMLKVHCEI